MALTCGIVGLPLSGKTTIFNLLTGLQAETSSYFTGKTETNRGMATIYDKRLTYLGELYDPKKVVYAQIECFDIPGLVRGSGEGRGVGNQFLAAIRDTDALIYVIRVFEDKKIEHCEDSIDPIRDWEIMQIELLVADMEIIERNIERIESNKKKTAEQEEALSGLNKCLQGLEQEIPIHRVELTQKEQQALQGYSFFTEKPFLVVINMDEKQYKEQKYPRAESVRKKAEIMNIPLVEICAKIEVEIGQLKEDERELFMEDIGIKEPGVDQLARASYDLLGLVSFFSIGQDEVKAWTIEKGTPAIKAAGKVHSDMEKGFIRAEVFHWSDAKKWDSVAKLKEKGLYRLEGKDYIVQDGDIIQFRFNV